MNKNKKIVFDYFKQYENDARQYPKALNFKYCYKEAAAHLLEDCEELDIFKEVANKIIDDESINLEDLNNYICSFMTPLEIEDD